MLKTSYTPSSAFKNMEVQSPSTNTMSRFYAEKVAADTAKNSVIN